MTTKNEKCDYRLQERNIMLFLKAQAKWKNKRKKKDSMRF